jgi:hypothetical protein
MTIINDINKDGFIFKKFMPNDYIYQCIINSKDPNEFWEIDHFFIEEFKKLGLEVDNVLSVYEDIKLGQSHVMHTHLIPADCQIVVWVPFTEYEGRAYLYGTKEEIKKFYPQFGDMVLMKTNDLNFIHGVEPLLNDTIVRTILFSVNFKGESGAQHITVDAYSGKEI